MPPREINEKQPVRYEETKTPVRRVDDRKLPLEISIPRSTEGGKMISLKFFRQGEKGQPIPTQRRICRTSNLRAVRAKTLIINKPLAVKRQGKKVIKKNQKRKVLRHE